ncbi:hypothetical protein MMC14_003188 [Varicellaria rhodocarpa]|nr:hypothetical protein [Varicellaria rhodocarpa]
MSIPYGKAPKFAKSHPKPINVAISDSSIEEFKQLLHLSKLAPTTYESLQEDRRFGITGQWLKDAKEHWEKNFDWRASEKNINSFPNFTLPVHDDDLDANFSIHFAGLFSEKEDAIPILLLHGWPGSFLEFLPILSLMKQEFSPDTLPYHLIVPSLPGYAFSSTPPLDKDFNTGDIARVMNSLMTELGFGNGYVAQGGDIGSYVGRVLGTEYQACKAVHINFCIMSEPEDTSLEVDSRERQGLQRLEQFRTYGSAYAFEHRTRPSTIGHVLASSSLALLAWISEKFLEWTDEDPPLDVILESVTLWWLTETFPRSIYPYRGTTPPKADFTHDNPKRYIHKPLGYSWFHKELAAMPKSWVATTGNLVFHRQHTKGGHFAALESPKQLKEDIVQFVEQVWKK